MARGQGSPRICLACNGEFVPYGPQKYCSKSCKPCYPRAARKVCRTCGAEKDGEDFSRNHRHRTGLHSECRACAGARGAKWRQDNAKRHTELNRRSKIKVQFGLTVEQYEEMMTAGCGICGADAAAMDHDHATGKVRGVLCLNCNTGLGMFEDDPDRMASAIEYLRSYRQARLRLVA